MGKVCVAEGSRWCRDAWRKVIDLVLIILLCATVRCLHSLFCVVKLEERETAFLTSF